MNRDEIVKEISTTVSGYEEDKEGVITKLVKLVLKLVIVQREHEKLSPMGGRDDNRRN